MWTATRDGGLPSPAPSLPHSSSFSETITLFSHLPDRETLTTVTRVKVGASGKDEQENRSEIGPDLRFMAHPFAHGPQSAPFTPFAPFSSGGDLSTLSEPPVEPLFRLSGRKKSKEAQWPDDRQVRTSSSGGIEVHSEWINILTIIPAKNSPGWYLHISNLRTRYSSPLLSTVSD